METKEETEFRGTVARVVNNACRERENLEKVHGKENVWDTKELQEKFEVLSFLAPFCSVREKATGREGTVMFQHQPRFYFDFTLDFKQRREV